MPDWAIVLLAAFGGGLAGAVLQPLVAHVLERVRFAEEIRKRRERGLRFMLEVQMDWARYLILATNIALLRQQAGAALSFEERSRGLGSGVFMYQKGVPPWNPDRIEDSQLRQLATNYYQAVRELAEEYYLPQIAKDRLQGLSKRLDETGAEIRHRMDELNWPEADYWAAAGPN